MSDPLAVHLHKRIRNIQKRKARIEKIALLPQESLVPDQVLALQKEPLVDTTLKELSEVMTIYNQFVEDDKKKQEEEKLQRDKEMEEWKEQVRKEEKNKVRDLLKFLRVASILRQLQINGSLGQNSKVGSGFERLLEKVYIGDESAVETVEKLYQASEDPVYMQKVDDGIENIGVSYKTIKQVCAMDEEVLLTTENLEEKFEFEGNENHSVTQDAPESAQPTDSIESKEAPGALAAEENKKISFLQQSEIEQQATETESSSEPKPATEKESLSGITDKNTTAPVVEANASSAPNNKDKKKKRHYRYKKKSTSNADTGTPSSNHKNTIPPKAKSEPKA